MAPGTPAARGSRSGAARGRAARRRTRGTRGSARRAPPCRRRRSRASRASPAASSRRGGTPVPITHAIFGAKISQRLDAGERLGLGRRVRVRRPEALRRRVVEEERLERRAALVVPRDDDDVRRREEAAAAAAARAREDADHEEDLVQRGRARARRRDDARRALVGARVGRDGVDVDVSQRYFAQAVARADRVHVYVNGDAHRRLPHGLDVDARRRRRRSLALLARRADDHGVSSLQPRDRDSSLKAIGQPHKEAGDEGAAHVSVFA